MQRHDDELNKTTREMDGQLCILNKVIPLHLTYWLSLFMSCEFQNQNTSKISIQSIGVVWYVLLLVQYKTNVNANV